jgi:hypothetical protein
MRHSLLSALFVLLSYFVSSLSAAQYETAPPQETENAVKELCKRVGCAFDIQVVLKQKDGSVFDKSYHVVPVVQPGGVSVYAGQSILFEADMQGDHLGNFKLIKSIEHPEKTISATLEQSSDNSMKLSLRNPFKQHLKIAMSIMLPDRGDLLIKTSSCPVVAGGGGYELWPYPVFLVSLSDMRLLKELNTTCSE